MSIDDTRLFHADFSHVEPFRFPKFHLRARAATRGARSTPWKWQWLRRRFARASVSDPWQVRSIDFSYFAKSALAIEFLQLILL
jgi:hypothetical protein